jgi:hypothetical protein
MAWKGFSKAERTVLCRLAARDLPFGGATIGYVHRLASGSGKGAAETLVDAGLVVRHKPRRGRSGWYRLAPTGRRAIPADFARQFRAFVLLNFANGIYKFPHEHAP